MMALTVLRRRQPGLPRPYRQHLYPLASLVSAAGWLYAYSRSGTLMISLSLGWVALGAFAFLLWARSVRTWPFGPLEIREAFLEGTKETQH